MVQGLVREGLFPVQVEVAAPAYTKPPSVGQILRIYRNPEDESQFSVLPEVTDGRFRHLALLAFAGLAFAGGAGCGVSHGASGTTVLAPCPRVPALRPRTPSASQPCLSSGMAAGPDCPAPAQYHGPRSDCRNPPRNRLVPV